MDLTEFRVRRGSYARGEWAEISRGRFAQRAVEGADIRDKQVRFLHRSEVPATADEAISVWPSQRLPTICQNPMTSLA